MFHKGIMFRPRACLEDLMQGPIIREIKGGTDASNTGLLLYRLSSYYATYVLYKLAL